MLDSKSFLKNLSTDGIYVSQPKSQMGGNSNIFRFKYREKDVILKVYKGDEKRIKLSREREIQAYKFLREKKFSQLPNYIEEIQVSDGICLEFIKGESPKQNWFTNIKIWRGISKLKAVYRDDSRFDTAVDASFSTSNVLNQIISRYEGLKIVSKPENDNLEIGMEILKKSKVINFPDSALTYSFSDIGTHNILKVKYKFIYLDLEFFGKDSAVKMVSDYLLHPKNQFSKNELDISLYYAKKYFGIESKLLLEAIPFFALKWATILTKRFIGQNNSLDLLLIKQKFYKYVEISKSKNSQEIYNKLIYLG